MLAIGNCIERDGVQGSGKMGVHKEGKTRIFKSRKEIGLLRCGIGSMRLRKKD